MEHTDRTERKLIQKEKRTMGFQMSDNRILLKNSSITVCECEVPGYILLEDTFKNSIVLHKNEFDQLVKIVATYTWGEKK